MDPPTVRTNPEVNTAELLDYLTSRGRELIAPGRVGNELAVYEEYDRHPRFGEGPWHLLPKGPVQVSGANNAAHWMSRVTKLATTSPATPAIMVQSPSRWRGGATIGPAGAALMRAAAAGTPRRGRR